MPSETWALGLGVAFAGLTAYSLLRRNPLSSYTYLVSRDSNGYYASNPDGEFFRSVDCSDVIQSIFDERYEVGAKTVFNIDEFICNKKIKIPYGTKSMMFEGLGAWIESGVPTGTVIRSTVDDALFEQESVINYRSSYGFSFHNTAFIGPSTYASSCFHLTNSTTGEISSNMFFQFGTHIIGDMNHEPITSENRDLIIREMPGLFDIHDNIFTEEKVCAVKFDMFMQNKLHDNEFEDWGPFVRQIDLINTNVININNNRFTANDETVPQQEVIKISTTNEIYCNQIHINDNIAYMGRGTPLYPFINMVNTTTYPTNDIVSRDNNLVLDYIPTIPMLLGVGTGMYVQQASLGMIDARDHVRFLNDQDNLKDFTPYLANDTPYQNNWAPLNLYFVANTIKSASAFIVLMGKTPDQMIIMHEYSNSTGDDVTGDVISFVLSIPVGYWFKYQLIGTTQLGSAYAVYNTMSARAVGPRRKLGLKPPAITRVG